MNRQKDGGLASTLVKEFPSVKTTSINNLFHHMDISEEEIARAQEAQPEYRDLLWDSFRYLSSDYLSDAGDELYRHHCQEILSRVVNGDNLDEATKSEVMYAISKTSLKAPLQSTSTYLYHDLFVEIMGYDPSPDLPTLEPYKKECNQLYEGIAKRLYHRRDVRHLQLRE